MAEDSITLVNKSVACKNPEILEFMYPSFMVKDDIFYDYEHDIIYNGKPQKDLKGMLAHGTRNFICTAGAPDVDFDNRDIQIKVLYDKWNKVANAKALEMLSKDNMMDDEFWEYFKKYWVLGSSKLDKDDGPRIYDMYKVLGKSKHDILRVYFELREVYGDKVILSSVLSFIEKAYNPDMVSSTNGLYIKMLNDFSKGMGANIKVILYGLYSLKTDDLCYKNLWLLSRLGKGEIL